MDARHRNRHIALVALLSLLASWFPAIFYAGAFAPKQVSPITLAKVLEEAASHNLALLRTIRPGQMDQFILDSGLKDAGKGFCKPLKWEDLMKHVNHRPVRLIPRFASTQSTGKVRPIDDADKGGQSKLSSDGNHLEFCSALRPAQHVWALHQAALRHGSSITQASAGMQSAGEDWPDAYRLVPMKPGRSMCGGFLSPSVGNARLSVILWDAFWSPPCSRFV